MLETAGGGGFRLPRADAVITDGRQRTGAPRMPQSTFAWRAYYARARETPAHQACGTPEHREKQDYGSATNNTTPQATHGTPEDQEIRTLAVSRGQ